VATVSVGPAVYHTCKQAVSDSNRHAAVDLVSRQHMDVLDALEHALQLTQQHDQDTRAPKSLVTSERSWHQQHGATQPHARRRESVHRAPHSTRAFIGSDAALALREQRKVTVCVWQTGRKHFFVR